MIFVIARIDLIEQPTENGTARQYIESLPGREIRICESEIGPIGLLRVDTPGELAPIAAQYSISVGSAEGVDPSEDAVEEVLAALADSAVTFDDALRDYPSFKVRVLGEPVE